MLPPTAYLPSIKAIASYPVATLEDALRYLHLIYNPPVRGSRRRRVLSVKSKQREDELAAEELRDDTFERAYAIKWLSALIAQCGGGGDDAEEDDSEGEGTTTRRELLIENAASLLATCAGTASAGIVTRQLVFEVPALDALPITIKLTDVPLDNQDYGSVGAQTWGGACIMAEMIAEDPGAFGLPKQGNRRPSRCLELGAGTGLVSLTIGKIVERLGCPVHIMATDYYPSVLENLERNVRSNFQGKPILSTSRLDWSTFCHVESKEALFQEPFDVIYGADIIYEALHATWIKSCLEILLRKPTSSFDDPIFHLIIPLRATHAFESNTIEEVFQMHKSDEKLRDDVELVVKHKQVIVCDAGSGKHGEEVVYAYYKIGWGFAS
ncbi:hypothetical protein BDN70DRAFT_852406 [Pholiota conissans]|uniref:Uncharacterized protein n=1 Tax=Pholiota conissans TaxID=109636 RepID=A0A9P6CXH1_9AGAR|nr:hypothetical protein BDN70DRAFT_852406 [Pholiota conissans]